MILKIRYRLAFPTPQNPTLQNPTPQNHCEAGSEQVWETLVAQERNKTFQQHTPDLYEHSPQGDVEKLSFPFFLSLFLM